MRKRPKCIGCEAAASAHAHGVRKIYCDACWTHRQEQIREEEQRFQLWRIARGADAELWGIAHPNSHADGPGHKVGEVWAVLDPAVSALRLGVFLEPAFDWNKKLVLLFPRGISAEESLTEILAGRLVSFFKGSFRADLCVVEIRFLTDKTLAFDVEWNIPD